MKMQMYFALRVLLQHPYSVRFEAALLQIFLLAPYLQFVVL